MKDLFTVKNWHEFKNNLRGLSTKKRAMRMNYWLSIIC